MKKQLTRPRPSIAGGNGYRNRPTNPWRCAMKKFHHICVKAIGLIMFFLGIFMMFYVGTDAGQADALLRAEALPSSTALATSFWYPVLLSAGGMLLYCSSVLSE